MPWKLSENIGMELAHVLKRLMQERDLSISQLSRQAKIPVQTLHNWLNNQKPKDINQVKKVADFFSVSIDFLCFGVEPRTITATPPLKDFENEIYAGVFEVVLRKVRSPKKD